ncbi:MAG: hypothetical protein V1660_03790 [archaeon]
MVKDSPLNEITLRRYENPYNLGKRDLVKKICLSLGLLQPGDSRDIIVDILLVLLEACKEKKELQLEEIKEKSIEIRKQNNLEIKGIADSNIRRQLKRLRDMMIADKNANSYRISEFESLSKIFDSKIRGFILQQIVERVGEYISELEK